MSIASTFQVYISAHLGETLTIRQIESSTGISRRSIFRYIQQYISNGKISQKSRGTYTIHIESRIYFKTPFFHRENKKYIPEFLDTYVPNVSTFFSVAQKNILWKALEKIDIHTDFFVQNKRLIEISLIDLSFASSSLEGNTYDYIETEILVRYNEIAKEKAQDETQMIL
jgi:hypothetical protein